MNRLGSRAALILAVCPGLFAAPASALEVQHQPLPCVVADRFVRIVAKASSPARTAELQFRTDPDGPWYALAMKPENGEWSAVLPRPTASLARFEYRIAMAGEGSEAAETPAYAVTVGADPSACGGAAQSAVSSSIVVRVPPGAPVVPPVPRGFNPTGVVAVEQPAPTNTKKALVIGGAAAAAGVAVVAALGGGSGSGPGGPGPDPVPRFRFEGTIPAPGATISMSRDTVQVLVRMDREPTSPLTLDWVVEWHQAVVGTLCASMSATFNGAQRPTSLVLTAPLAPGRCGASFEASTLRITILVAAQIALDLILTDLPFRFEP
jgi:hypothetical protein